MLIHLLLGFQYTWGIFDRALQEQYGFAATATQSVLGAQIVMFAATFVVAGWALHHFGPRITTVTGGMLYGISLLIGGTFGQDPRALFWGTGVLFGVGLAFGYIGPIVTAVKWFPKYKGVVTGLVVSFYGCGSFVLAGVAKWLLAHELTAFQVLNAFGIAAGWGVVLLGLVLTNPPGEEVEAKKSRFPKGLVKTGHFWALVVGFFAGTVAGLSIVGSIERIGRTLGTPEWWLAMGVMVFAAGNTAGRVAWGTVTELIGTRRAVAAALISQSACVAAMILAGARGPAFVLLTLFIGFNYGANFVLFITDVSRTYGPDRVGSVYGLINFVYIGSGFFGAPAAGFSYDHWKSYVPSMGAAAGVLFVGAIVFLALYRHVEAEPSGAGEAGQRAPKNADTSGQHL